MTYLMFSLHGSAVLRNRQKTLDVERKRLKSSGEERPWNQMSEDLRKRYCSGDTNPILIA